ncbi:Flagellar brake protein YcgR [Cupriavidus yeoncheonensis]|uniref:Flagellar brake protein YcgR n=1 Tax=Cupriavidus yeoncheonensis TaxID=1462994 RepID=A0A916MX27_9BURK|nr:flagellar brake protein [Cupriavidus yeoncheonensis]CAG2152581.1 Flagellar brake protein YcgR [Cupriavidus yeoncheonensis]
MHLAESSTPAAIPGAAIGEALPHELQEGFRLDGTTEIGAILSDLAWLGSAVRVRNQFGHELSTRVLQADLKEHRLVLDRSMSAEDESELADSRENLFLASIRGAPVAFQSGAPRKVKFKGRLAFEVPFPACLYYVQRRRHFRAPVPPDAGFLCLIQNGNLNRLQLDIVDVSLSGVRLRGRIGAGLRFGDGAKVRGAVMDFGPYGKLSVDIRIMASRAIDEAEAGSVYYGCAFLDLPVKAENLLQRLVTSLELSHRRRGM